MQAIHNFDAGHDDLIHDLSYDFYGKRLATCSSDQKIKVWDLDDETGGWTLNDSWKAHDGSVLKVSWAHPEFGAVFASCSIDRTIKIWEEQEHEAKGSGRRWKLRATLGDSRGSVQDIEFSSNHLGLRLASCSADGFIRIYEAMDVVNLSNWTLMTEFEVVSGCKEADRLCLSWCPSRFQSQMLVIGCGRDNVARVYGPDNNNVWQIIENLSGHQDMVTDVAWAPNMGRSFQLIATACKDGTVRIYKMTDEDRGIQAWDSSNRESVKKLGKWRMQLIASFDDHKAEVWRVDWNIMGTILSSSGDDGRVRLWKSTFLDEWRAVGEISTEK